MSSERGGDAVVAAEDEPRPFISLVDAATAAEVEDDDAMAAPGVALAVGAANDDGVVPDADGIFPWWSYTSCSSNSRSPHSIMVSSRRASGATSHPFSHALSILTASPRSCVWLCSGMHSSWLHLPPRRTDRHLHHFRLA